MTTAIRTKASPKKQKRNREATNSNKPKAEDMVADKIIELLDKGDLPPWSRPWRYCRLGDAHNAISKKPYRGINVWLLAIASATHAYSDARWLTYKQAQQLGGSVRKGEKSTWIVFWKIMEKSQEQDNPSDPDALQVFDQTEQESLRPPRYPVARIYNVFNVEQTEGCKLPELELTDGVNHDPIEQAEAIIRNMPTPPEFRTILQANQPPHYIPAKDMVRVPDVTRYDQVELYYNSVFHELVHATGHEKRLRRFDSADTGLENLHTYGTEELVAGMGAAMLTAKAGLEHATLEADASYIKHWADRIRADKSMVMTAAQRAQKAMDFIAPRELANRGEADVIADDELSHANTDRC